MVLNARSSSGNGMEKVESRDKAEVETSGNRIEKSEERNMQK